MLRHLRVILFLPFVALVVVPGVIYVAARPMDTRWPFSLPAILIPLALGAALLVVGLWLFIWCVWNFAAVGRGTLAPWDPPQKLVVVGPYRRVRNPMISGVWLMLMGQAIATGSAWVLTWALLFLTANHLFFLFVEEPALEKRFGESYREYKARVPRWIPLFGRRKEEGGRRKNGNFHPSSFSSLRCSAPIR